MAVLNTTFLQSGRMLTDQGGTLYVMFLNVINLSSFASTLARKATHPPDWSSKTSICINKKQWRYLQYMDFLAIGLYKRSRTAQIVSITKVRVGRRDKQYTITLSSNIKGTKWESCTWY